MRNIHIWHIWDGTKILFDWSQNLSSGTKFKNYDGLEIEPTPKKIWLENMITRTKLFESNWTNERL